jgi:hypothetical protein
LLQNPLLMWKCHFQVLKWQKISPNKIIVALIGSPRRCVSCDGLQKHFSCFGLMAKNKGLMGLAAGHGLWLPLHLILSLMWNFSLYQVNVKRWIFFCLKVVFLQNKGKAKKNEALKWKSNFCIALKTLSQGNLQGKLVVFFSKILLLHHMGISLEKFNIYNLSKKIFKTTTK